MEKPKINSFKDLRTWQKSISFISEIYSLTGGFPSKEQFGLTSQLNRAAVSIACNIAEGWGRESKKSFIQFLRISRGSLFEVDTLLIIAVGQKYLDNNKYQGFSEQIDEIGKMLNSFIISIEKKIDQ